MSAQKSTVTLFTSQTQQSHHHPRAHVNGSPLPLDRCPAISGVTIDPHLYNHHHVDNVVKKAKLRLDLFRLLCGTNWGQYKETILATFKSMSGSFFTFAAPIWFPNTSELSIKKLQTIQNSALRFGTGCVGMTTIDHLHTEAKTLKVDKHLGMLCSQFLAASL